MSSKSQCGIEALNHFISSLYNELFDAVVMLLNRSLGSNNLTSSASITIIDYPGSNFNRPWVEVMLEKF